MRHHPLLPLVMAASLAAHAQEAAPVRLELTEVVAGSLDKTTVIPGELRPFQRVDIHAKVSGFVDEVRVDRGSRVTRGRVLVVMSAPELQAQRAEASARIAAAEAERAQAEAQLAAAEGTHTRLVEAARTPGVVAGHDVMLAEKAAEAERARLASTEGTIAAHRAALRAIEETERYLRVTAPFDGVITARFAHVGTLAGPAGDGGAPLLTIEQVRRLRLVASLPEAYTQSIVTGREVEFSVLAHPGRRFVGAVARPAYSVDTATRTMPVELDVDNPDGLLSPGMYAEVAWPIRRAGDSLLVPASAIEATTERIFVIRVRAGVAEWVDVRRGLAQGNQVEIFGDVAAGDTVVVRATDEIRPGTRVEPAT